MRTASRALELGGPVLLTIFMVVVSGQIDPSNSERALDALAYALVVVCGLSLLWVRRQPVAVAVVIVAALAVWLARDYAGGPIFVTMWIAFFVLGASVPRRIAYGVAGAAMVVLVVVSVIAGSNPEPLVHALLVSWSLLAVLAGDALRGREERARQLEQHREDETRRRLTEERLRIARDVHDTVAHSMATINVQAGAAAHVIDRQPDQARDALRVIQQASGEALDELATLLQLLRVDPAERPATTPTPGLTDLETLIASARRAGLDVAFRVEAGFGAVPRAVDVAAYRIVQESLTNVVRHAGFATATVSLRRRDDGGPEVEIIDDGTALESTGVSGTGVGIRGMRERAESTGGWLEAGPLPGGGFRVVAAWPAPVDAPVDLERTQ